MVKLLGKLSKGSGFEYHWQPLFLLSFQSIFFLDFSRSDLCACEKNIFDIKKCLHNNLKYWLNVLVNHICHLRRFRIRNLKETQCSKACRLHIITETYTTSKAEYEVHDFLYALYFW